MRDPCTRRQLKKEPCINKIFFFPICECVLFLFIKLFVGGLISVQNIVQRRRSQLRVHADYLNIIFTGNLYEQRHGHPCPKLSVNSFTHSLTPRSRIVLEKITGSQWVTKCPELSENPRFITVFVTARHLFLSRARWIPSMPLSRPHSISWRSILILSSHLRLCLQIGLLSSGFLTKSMYAPLISPIRATWSANLSLSE